MPVGNAVFEPILQCVSRDTATRLVWIMYYCLTGICHFQFVRNLRMRCTCPCGRVVSALGRHVQQSVTHSVARVRLSLGASAYQKVISNNSYAHDEQGVNPGQVRGFDSVLYKL